MTIDKKEVLDQLYILKNALIKKATHEHNISIDKSDDVCLNNLAIGRSDGYEKSWIALDTVIRTIIDLSEI